MDHFENQCVASPDTFSGPFRARNAKSHLGEGDCLNLKWLNGIGNCDHIVTKRGHVSSTWSKRVRMVQLKCQPEWRNWQTRQVEGLVPVMGVQVQVLSPALSSTRVYVEQA